MMEEAKIDASAKEQIYSENLVRLLKL